jgi:hypothetical protein
MRKTYDLIFIWANFYFQKEGRYKVYHGNQWHDVTAVSDSPVSILASYSMIYLSDRIIFASMLNMHYTCMM